MPIFEFKCKKCNKNFEKLIRSSSNQTKCPFCCSEDTEKQLSSFAFQGSGITAPSSGHSCSSCSGHNCSSCH